LFVLSDANWPANVPSPSEETPLINFFSSPAVRSLLARSRRPLDEINFGPSKAKLFDYICENASQKGIRSRSIKTQNGGGGGGVPTTLRKNPF
jgi:hypothetical protein